MEELIVFPECENLKAEVERLRTELSMLMLEYDELRFVICKNIETEYMLKLGGLEYRAYEAQCTALRLKREIELIQARKNRQEKIDLENITGILDWEFAEYVENLNKQVDKMNQALDRSQSEQLPEDESQELKRLYRKIVKALHPDIHPDISPEQLELFHHAVEAYKNGDLETLRIISAMLGDDIAYMNNEDSISRLRKEKARLEEMIRSVRDSIAKIKQDYPYTMKEILEDEDKLAQRKAELEEILQHYTEWIKIYEDKIKEMLGE